MTTTLRRTPLDLPRGASFRRTYRAVLRDDGSVFPIEERLGRRLLRTIDPNSREGREILRCGIVRLTSSEPRRSAGDPAAAPPLATAPPTKTVCVSGRRVEAPDALAGSEWARICRDARERIETMRRALTRDH